MRRGWTVAGGLVCLGLAQGGCWFAMRGDDTEARPGTPTAHAGEIGRGRTSTMVKNGVSTPVHRTGTITAVTGSRTLAVGQRCTLDVNPITAAQFNCGIVIACGGGQLYRGTTQCGVAGGTFVRATDPWPTHVDHDPVLEIDLVAGTLLLDDGAHRDNLVVRVSLDPA